MPSGEEPLSRKELRSMADALLDVADEIVSTFPFQANQLRNLSRVLSPTDQKSNEQAS
jgi:hypothetical protein